MEHELDIYRLTEQRQELANLVDGHFNLKSIFKFERESIPDWCDVERHIEDWRMWADSLLLSQAECFRDLRCALQAQLETQECSESLNTRFIWQCSIMDGTMHSNFVKSAKLRALLQASSDAVKSLPDHVSLSTRLVLLKALVRKARATRFRDTMPRVLVKGLPAIMCGKDA
jgi:hypothetical protein